MNGDMTTSRSWPFVVGLILVALASYSVIGTPFLLIQPFSQQSDTDLAVGYALDRWGLVLTLSFLGIGAFLFGRAWQRSGSLEGQRTWLVRGIAGAVMVALVGPAYLAYREQQVNAYERYFFAAITEVGFVAAADADFLEDADLVLGIEIDGQAKAYPVGALGYHHLVNDELGGVPLVATY